MEHVVNNYKQLLEKVRELVKDGYRQTDVTEHEIVFEKGLHARNTIFPTFWEANKLEKHEEI